MHDVVISAADVADVHRIPYIDLWTRLGFHETTEHKLHNHFCSPVCYAMIHDPKCHSSQPLMDPLTSTQVDRHLISDVRLTSAISTGSIKLELFLSGCYYVCSADILILLFRVCQRLTLLSLLLPQLLDTHFRLKWPLSHKLPQLSHLSHHQPRVTWLQGKEMQYQKCKRPPRKHCTFVSLWQITVWCIDFLYNRFEFTMMIPKSNVACYSLWYWVLAMWCFSFSVTG